MKAAASAGELGAAAKSRLPPKSDAAYVVSITQGGTEEAGPLIAADCAAEDQSDCTNGDSTTTGSKRTALSLEADYNAASQDLDDTSISIVRPVPPSLAMVCRVLGFNAEAYSQAYHQPWLLFGSELISAIIIPIYVS